MFRLLPVTAHSFFGELFFPVHFLVVVYGAPVHGKNAKTRWPQMETADQRTVGGHLFWSNKHFSFALLPPPFFMPHSSVSHPRHHAPTPREQWRHLQSPLVILFHLLITHTLKIHFVSSLGCPIGAVCCSLVVRKPSESHQQKGRKKNGNFQNVWGLGGFLYSYVAQTWRSDCSQWLWSVGKKYMGGCTVQREGTARCQMASLHGPHTLLLYRLALEKCLQKRARVSPAGATVPDQSSCRPPPSGSQTEGN